MEFMSSTKSVSHVEVTYAKSPTAQDTFRPIPGLISCAGVTYCIMHRMQLGGWPYSKVGRDSLKAPSLHAAVLRAFIRRSYVTIVIIDRHMLLVRMYMVCINQKTTRTLFGNLSSWMNESQISKGPLYIFFW